MIGNLNQRCAIQQPVRTPDGTGGATESWSTLALVWAKLEPVSASSAFGPDAREAKARHRIVIRRLASAAPGMQAVIGPRVFTIEGVLDAGAQEAFMTLLCEEKQ